VSSPDTIVDHGPADRSTFALTYDDGPEWPGTDQLLRVLAARGVQATFFCVGEQVESYPDLAGKLVKAGHEIGCHTMRHLDHYLQTDQACTDMIEGAATIERLLGVGIGLYRAPYGHFVPETVLEAERRGWTCVLWTTLGEDWHADESAATIAGRVIADLAPGAIVLLHDAQRYAHERDDCTPTIEASELVLDEAKRRGLAPVTVGELLGIES
jgi:peptidoglycan/xylan/chitin deacetylase (PgdA/CDA1 family)